MTSSERAREKPMVAPTPPNRASLTPRCCETVIARDRALKGAWPCPHDLAWTPSEPVPPRRCTKGEMAHLSSLTHRLGPGLAVALLLAFASSGVATAKGPDF